MLHQGMLQESESECGTQKKANLLQSRGWDQCKHGYSTCQPLQRDTFTDVVVISN